MDADSGLVHTVVDTAANVYDVTQAGKLLHGQEVDVFADAGYQDVAKREEVSDANVNWHIAMLSGKRRALNKGVIMAALLINVSNSKLLFEHPSQIVKYQWDITKSVTVG